MYKIRCQNKMVIDLDEYITGDVLHKIKMYISGYYLTPYVAYRINSVATLFLELEYAGRIGPGHYEVLLEILNAIGYRRKEVLDIIKKYTERWYEGMN